MKTINKDPKNPGGLMRSKMNPENNDGFFTGFLIDPRKFDDLLFEWIDRTKGLNNFMRELGLVGIYTPEEITKVLTGEILPPMDFCYYLSSQIPPSICGKRAFINRAIKYLANQRGPVLPFDKDKRDHLLRKFLNDTTRSRPKGNVAAWVESRIIERFPHTELNIDEAIIRIAKSIDLLPREFFGKIKIPEDQIFDSVWELSKLFSLGPDEHDQLLTVALFDWGTADKESRLSAVLEFIRLIHGYTLEGAEDHSQISKSTIQAWELCIKSPSRPKLLSYLRSYNLPPNIIAQITGLLTEHQACQQPRDSLSVSTEVLKDILTGAFPGKPMRFARAWSYIISAYPRSTWNPFPSPSWKSGVSCPPDDVIGEISVHLKFSKEQHELLLAIAKKDRLERGPAGEYLPTLNDTFPEILNDTFSEISIEKWRRTGLGRVLTYDLFLTILKGERYPDKQLALILLFFSNLTNSKIRKIAEGIECLHDDTISCNEQDLHNFLLNLIEVIINEQDKSPEDKCSQIFITARRIKGLTLREVSKCFGISESLYNSYEHGATLPSKDFIERFSSYFKLDGISGALTDLLSDAAVDRSNLSSLLKRRSNTFPNEVEYERSILSEILTYRDLQSIVAGTSHPGARLLLILSLYYSRPFEINNALPEDNKWPLVEISEDNYLNFISKIPEIIETGKEPIICLDVNLSFLPNLMRIYRILSNTTLEQASTKIGINRTNIGGVESGKRRCKKEFAIDLLKIYCGSLPNGDTALQIALNCIEKLERDSFTSRISSKSPEFGYLVMILMQGMTISNLIKSNQLENVISSHDIQSIMKGEKSPGVRLSRVLQTCFEVDFKQWSASVEVARNTIPQIEISQEQYNKFITSKICYLQSSRAPFGKILHFLRIVNGQTLKNVADGLGVTTTLVSRWERGNSPVPPHRVSTVGKHFSLNLSETATPQNHTNAPLKDVSVGL